MPESNRLKEEDETSNREPPTTSNYCISTMEQTCAFRKGLTRLDNDIRRLIVFQGMRDLVSVRRLPAQVMDW